MLEAMTRVKICGITNRTDALLAAENGADALGFNFYPRSPRYVTSETAREIAAGLPAGVRKIGVFVNEQPEPIAAAVRTAGLDAVQLHGDEAPGQVSEIRRLTGLPVIKAFRVGEGFRSARVLEYEVEDVLLDAYSPREYGGTGETFDWATAREVRELTPRLYLAGGLNVGNVGRAVAEVGPYAVDVCSGIESSKGLKDRELLVKFLSIVRKISE